MFLGHTEIYFNLGCDRQEGKNKNKEKPNQAEGKGLLDARPMFIPHSNQKIHYRYFVLLVYNKGIIIFIVLIIYYYYLLLYLLLLFIIIYLLLFLRFFFELLFF